MPPASKLGDMVMHAAHTPATIMNGSPNVLINSTPASTVGSMVSVHCLMSYPFPCHPSTIASGSSTVLVNGKPLTRMGDKSGCGGIVIKGSPNVIAG
jgi:uncharacterized Zn-binding protein involved in type VI secretion